MTDTKTNHTPIERDLLDALKAVVEACATKDYRDPLSHAQIADLAQAAIAKAQA